EQSPPHLVNLYEVAVEVVHTHQAHRILEKVSEFILGSLQPGMFFRLNRYIATETEELVIFSFVFKVPVNNHLSAPGHARSGQRFTFLSRPGPAEYPTQIVGIGIQQIRKRTTHKLRYFRLKEF